MSLTAPTMDAMPPASESLVRGRSGLGVLVAAVVVCALVLASGGVRWWQVRRVEAMMSRDRESKFPLDSLPMTLGDWVGEKTELDPVIVARTGSNDLITRRYTNRITGVTIETIILHGPASEIFIHAPDNCYPRAGYTPAGEAMDRAVSCGGTRVLFRSVAYTKGDPAHADTQEILYAWRYNGRWTTSVNRPKEMERVPGMYKVQVSRRLLPTESRTVADPCEAFLALMVPALEARILGQSSPPGPSGP
jgi:hypothetical protein